MKCECKWCEKEAKVRTYRTIDTITSSHNECRDCADLDTKYLLKRRRKKENVYVRVVKYFVANNIQSWKIDTFNHVISWHDEQLNGTNSFWRKDVENLGNEVIDLQDVYSCNKNSQIAREIMKIFKCKMHEFFDDIQERKSKEQEAWRKKNV